MTRQEQLYVAACLGTIAFAVAFVFPHFAAHPIAWYFPLERRWSFEVRPNALAIDFYGRFAQAAVAWAATVVLSLAVTRRIKAISDRTIGLLCAWALALTLLVMLYYAWTLFWRIPTPEPVPDWYRPR